MVNRIIPDNKNVLSNDITESTSKANIVKSNVQNNQLCVNKLFTKSFIMQYYCQLSYSGHMSQSSSGQTLVPTISKSGCALTSFTMVMDYFKSLETKHIGSLNPENVLACLKPKLHDNPLDWLNGIKDLKGARLLPYNLNLALAKLFGHEVAFETAKVEIFKTLFTNNVPVLVCLRVPGKDEYHHIVIKGFSGMLPIDSNCNPDLSAITADMFIVNDPINPKYTTLGASMKRKKPEFVIYSLRRYILLQ